MSRKALPLFALGLVLAISGCKKHEDTVAQSSPLPDIDVGAFPMHSAGNVVLYWSWMTELAKNWHDPDGSLLYINRDGKPNKSCMPGHPVTGYGSAGFPLICYASPAVSITPEGHKKDILSLAETPLVSVTKTTLHGDIVEGDFTSIMCDPQGQTCSTQPVRHLFIPFQAWLDIRGYMRDIQGVQKKKYNPEESKKAYP